MTTYTERTLGATTFTERSLATPSYTQRSLATPTFTERSAMATVTWTERGTVTPTYFTTDTTTTVYGDDEPPAISNAHANLMYATYVELDWDTDEPANCLVYWTTNSVATLGVWNKGDTHAHYITNNRRYVVSSLAEKTTYYYRMQSEDVFGNGVRSDTYYFITPGATDNTPGTLPALGE